MYMPHFCIPLMLHKPDAPALRFARFPSGASDQPAAPATRRALARAGRQAGMTLLEIMIVLAIIALVMGLLVGPRVFKMFGESQESLARTEMKQLVYEAFPRWAMRGQGSCPGTLSELTEFTNKKDVKDPWGNEYTMHCGDNAPQGERFGISSKGSDGKDGTGDDIKSWAEPGAK